MMTNVIAYLYTTFAYQSAAMHLMVGQANFEAQQLHLKESLPITVPADTNEWKVAMPPDGISGGFATANYVYRFKEGRLIAIEKKPQPRRTAVNAPETELSQVDTNGAYELAREWLAGISVNVPALESQYPHDTLQYSLRSASGNREYARGGDRLRLRPEVAHEAPTNAAATRTSATKLPTFRVTWGGGRGPRSERTPIQATMDILGTTKQCAGLRIFNPDLLKAPPLQLTNVAALLGPLPAPQYFVEQFLGGRAAYNTVAAPERVVVWPLTGQAENQTNRGPAVAADAGTAAAISRALTDFSSYAWLEQKACLPEYGVHLRFTKGADTVDILWCYQCDHLQVTHNGQTAERDCDAAHFALVRAIQTLFPSDAIFKNLTLLNPTQTK